MYMCILRNLQSNLLCVCATHQFGFIPCNGILSDRFANTLLCFISFFPLHPQKQVLTLQSFFRSLPILHSAVSSLQPPRGWQPHSSVEWYVLWHCMLSLWTWLVRWNFSLLYTAAFPPSPLHALTAPRQMCCEIWAVANATVLSQETASEFTMT